MYEPLERFLTTPSCCCRGLLVVHEWFIIGSGDPRSITDIHLQHGAVTMPRILYSLLLLLIMSGASDHELALHQRICLCTSCFEQNADTPPMMVRQVSRTTVQSHWKKYRNPLIDLQYWSFADSPGGLMMRPAFTLRHMLQLAQAKALDSQGVDGGVVEEQVAGGDGCVVEEQVAPAEGGVVEEEVHVAAADAAVPEEHVPSNEEEEMRQAKGKLPGYDGCVEVRNRLKSHGSSQTRNDFARANDDAIRFFLTMLASKVKHNHSIAAVDLQLRNFKATELFKGSDWGRTPDNFTELLIFADVHGWVFIPEYVYDVCKNCYYVYRGLEEVQAKATSCRRCNHPRLHCKKYYYRCVVQIND